MTICVPIFMFYSSFDFQYVFHGRQLTMKQSSTADQKLQLTPGCQCIPKCKLRNVFAPVFVRCCTCTRAGRRISPPRKGMSLNVLVGANKGEKFVHGRRPSPLTPPRVNKQLTLCHRIAAPLLFQLAQSADTPAGELGR